MERGAAADASKGSNVPEDSLLSLQYSKVEKPDKEDEMHVVMATQALHTQICPAVVQAAAALVAHSMQAFQPRIASGECMNCTLCMCQAQTDQLNLTFYTTKSEKVQRYSKETLKYSIYFVPNTAKSPYFDLLNKVICQH